MAKNLTKKMILMLRHAYLTTREKACTFYGTANSNQMLLEAMGLHVPGTAFVNPGDDLREQLTREATRTVLGIVKGPRFTPIGRLVDERAIVNAMCALLATGGSTNHLIHWVAVARSAGISIDWDDFAQLSAVVPLLARVYPNGSADVNQFQAAGGPGYVIRELLDAGLMHEDVLTVRGPSRQVGRALAEHQTTDDFGIGYGGDAGAIKHHIAQLRFNRIHGWYGTGLTVGLDGNRQIPALRHASELTIPRKARAGHVGCVQIAQDGRCAGGRGSRYVRLAFPGAFASSSARRQHRSHGHHTQNTESLFFHASSNV